MSRIGTRLRRLPAIVICTAAIATAVVTAPTAAAAPPAAPVAAPSAAVADPPTVQACCSYIRNGTNLPVVAYKSWTCGHGTTGTASTSCVNPNGTWRWVAANDSTPVFEDWDALRIDGGWCYRVELHVPGKTWTVTYNRVGLGHTYVKVEDWGRGLVTAQAYNRCP